MEGQALAAGGGVLDIAAGDARSGGGEGTRILVAEAVAHALVIEFDLELAAAEGVGAAGDLIEKLAGADVAVRDGDGALQEVVGQNDGGWAGADVDGAGGG